jgi:predicted nucleotidyltransferase component of viral defense system
VIARDEILGKSVEFGINPSDVQRDYVFGWLITGLFAESKLASLLALKGGNALRKAYFPATRFSDDLDFTTSAGLAANQLVEEFNQVCRFAQARSGVEFDLSRNQLSDEYMIDRTRRVYKLRLYFRDFFGNAGEITLKVRIDVTEYDRIYLPLQSRRLIHPYSDADDCNIEIRCIKLEEALADKLKCLLQRRYSHDLFDLAYAVLINNALDIDRGELIRTFLRKTIFEPSPPTARLLLLSVPFDVMRGFWDRIVCPAAARLPFEEAVAGLKQVISELFAPFGYGGQLAQLYFPAQLRNPILEAGAGQRLLRLTYDGITRAVEPYSLVFKRRQDGVTQEYFYGWDRTGGHSGGPGIRAFLQGRVQRVAVADETFEPRFEVELGKAGDRPQGGDLSEPFASGPRSVRRHLRSRSMRRYSVRCPYCGRTFTRSTSSTRLNEHKDGYGNRCYGRIGIRV